MGPIAGSSGEVPGRGRGRKKGRLEGRHRRHRQTDPGPAESAGCGDRQADVPVGADGSGALAREPGRSNHDDRLGMTDHDGLDRRSGLGDRTGRDCGKDQQPGFEQASGFEPASGSAQERSLGQYAPDAEGDDEDLWWFDPDRQVPTDAELFGLWPDPFAGPPDGENAWLADLSVPELDEVARQWEAEHPSGPEAIGAGFTHRDRSETGLGFGAGGPLDELSPGVVLNVFAEDAHQDGLNKLSDDELVGFLCATRRLASRQEAMELEAVAEIDARRLRAAAPPESSRAGEHVSAELAAALMLTGRSADSLLCLARDLVRLPRILQALREGRLDRARAAVFATELANLDEFTAQTIAMALCLAAENMTTGQLRAELRRMILMVDPDAARRRAEKARGEARVEAWQETSGNGAISGRELPTAEMISADKRISAIARFLKSAGTPGSMDQIRAAVFSALLNGRDPTTLLPIGPDPAASSSGGAGQPSGGSPSDAAMVRRSSGDSGASEPGVGESGVGESGAGRKVGAGKVAAGKVGAGRRDAGPTGARGNDSGWLAGLTGSVNLTIPLSTYLGLTELPGEVGGIGAVDAIASRELADRLKARDGNRWCLTVTDENGRAVGHACSRRGPETARDVWATPPPPGDPPPRNPPPGSHAPWDAPSDKQPSGNAPWDGPRSDQARPGKPGGPVRPAEQDDPAWSGEPGGSGAAERSRRGRHRADRKGDWRTKGPATREADPAGRIPGTAVPGAGAGMPWSHWLSALEVIWLERGQCAHRREMSTYRPGPLLRHLIKVRQRTCSFPGCRRPANACDDDHTTAFDQGGRTCECNLAPLCRRHHRAKQAAGWRLDQAEPGFLVWTLPSGRTRMTGPGRYPAEPELGNTRIEPA